ncbi:precorrin-2 dehydrogenase/sirohydrochlorin ferrochelatase family protein [Clostridium vincentii]|uniref:precorrin-2 dehydrogenase n=1 Tax=Clostridium vincentii TaxID=52704 RepID=A0A2T0BE88_9CLOT|nr:bifunctional precorrin-2 dehydrogenase/sirohydrochlorin ferrochelatase [Clostridium vincentii]PRR82210.1 Siroheme synthase [Clostridium vincentii]
MAKYYPMMLNIENKKCLIVGGGDIAHRKIFELIEYGASITVVSPNINEKIKVLADNSVINYIKDRYDKSYIEDIYIVVASTNDFKVNNQIFRDCSERRILVNIVDDPKNCSFIVPSKIKRGDLTIAISTNGKSPTLSRCIRENLEKIYDEDYETFLNILGDVRQEVMGKFKDYSKKKEIFNVIMKRDYLTKLKLFGEDIVREELDEYLKTL